LVFAITWPASVLSHRFERSPNKKGKDFVKFVDGLANVAGNRSVRVFLVVSFYCSRAGAPIVRFLITGVMNWSARAVKDEIYAFGANSFAAPVRSVAFL
jgi:hypothetical protein